ncbi:MAG: RDD family protein [Terracidiphilus sp.]
MLVGNMKAKHFRWLFLPLLAALAVVLGSAEAPFTIGLHQEFSQDKYRFAGGTAPWALAFAGLFIGLYFLLMHAPCAKNGPPVSGWWRRTIAFWLDFILAVTALSAIFGLLPTLTEWRRTGFFAWNFERTSPAPGDALLTETSFALDIPVLILYFAWPIVRRRPTPGACIMGYLIVADDGAALTLGKAIKRTLHGLTFLGDRKRATFRVDESFGTHAARLE